VTKLVDFGFPRLPRQLTIVMFNSVAVHKSCARFKRGSHSRSLLGIFRVVMLDNKEYF
jgi:hypothetical protein